MSFRVRQSRFRHVFGQPLKRDQCYDNLRITRSSWDSNFCEVNPKYVAVITEAAGGGAFLVIPLEKVGRIERDHPTVCGHKAAVLDLAWCPHNDDIIASGSEDCTVKVWQIPDGGVRVNLEECVADLTGHQRRVGVVTWHPTAANILLSAGCDNKVIIWNCGTEEMVSVIEFPDIVFSACWNSIGSRVVTSCKDKKIRIIDPREGTIIKTSRAHEGAKPVQAIYLKDDLIFTTGFSRMSARQYGLWNPDMENKVIEEIDNSNGVIFPFYDIDTNIVYLCGKGDSAIRYFEVTDESPYVHFLAMYQSSEPQRGIGYMPKRGVNVNTCEIARFYKLHQKGLCEVIPFTVPRKSELFQDDLYPDTASDEPALDADEWINGKDANPIMMSMKDHFKEDKPSGATKKKANILTKKVKKVASAGGEPASTVAPAHAPSQPISRPKAVPEAQVAPAAPAAAPTPAAAPAAAAQPAAATLPAGMTMEELVTEARSLRTTVRQHEQRIKALEDKIAQFEINPESGGGNETGSTSDEGEAE